MLPTALQRMRENEEGRSALSRFAAVTEEEVEFSNSRSQERPFFVSPSPGVRDRFLKSKQGDQQRQGETERPGRPNQQRRQQADPAALFG